MRHEGKSLSLPMKIRHFRKDESLDQLAELINVAQFVSFSPGTPVRQEYARVQGYPPNHVFESLRDAIQSLLQNSPDSSINIRSFAPDATQGNEFVYQQTDVDNIEATVLRMARSGLNVIINETVDVHDGGVSGVIQGGIIEFAPDDTPRCVEREGIASFPLPWGIAVLQRIYGFPIELDYGPEYRLEFSIHPKPRGWKHTHILGWELEKIEKSTIEPSKKWPNKFSRLIGDKAFGLLLGSEIGLPVPKTTVISRRLAPFNFGDETGSAERWLRTCPKEQIPGKFTTHHGWIDPFTLLAKEDPTGDQISSVLAQYAIPSDYSGALIVAADGRVIIEGKAGEGEAFMKGAATPEQLPESVTHSVRELYDRAYALLGPVRLEWVYDGGRTWVVQLHQGATQTQESILVPGEASKWYSFKVSRGLEELRNELSQLGENDGIVLVGQVGLTSHIADIVRKTNKPARLDSSAAS
jgi:hypothetical protein